MNLERSRKRYESRLSVCLSTASLRSNFTTHLSFTIYFLQMKSVRLQNKISSGPQSNILEGVTWEEVRRVDAVDGRQTDHVVMVGAASKGIIQRDFQHNATVYKSAYAKNPFEGVTDKEIEEYKRYVEKKQRGEPGMHFLACAF